MNYAVLVGINSYQQVSGLNGCINDIEDVANRLISTNSASASNIIRLIDSAATKAAIVSAIKDVMVKLKFGDRAYFHFSGHGVQLPTSDPGEGEGLDEVLCAYDFDWSAATALADDELYKLLLDRSPGSEVLVTIDSCHSGDQIRAPLAPYRGVVRTLTPPASLRAEIQRRSGLVHTLRAISRGPGIAFLSACSPWQVAADTSFEGRPNGAFTYYFLREEQAAPAESFERLCARITPHLSTYSMTPVVEGDVNLSWRGTNTRSLILQRGAGDMVRAPSLVRGSQVLVEQTFEASLAGQSVALHLRITADNGQVLLFASLSIFGTSIAIPAVVIAGNQHVELPLGMLGARLVIEISGWALTSGSLRFNLDLSLATSMWFVPAVHVGRLPVSLPTSRLTRAGIPAATTPSDLVALLALQGQPNGSVRDPEPTVQAYRDPRLQVFANGVAEWGPNWREDRHIRPFESRPRPEGIQRMHVEIGPQRGAGNVYVVGWTSAQETDFDFILHMGNGFFGGWGSIEWRVVGFYYNESPFPRGLSLSAKTTQLKVPSLKASHLSNGSSRALEDELAMPMPEAGGSIRA